MNPAYEKAHNILAMAYEEAVWKDPTTLRTVLEFEDDLDKFFSLEDDKTGFGSGWQKLDEEDIRFRLRNCGVLPASMVTVNLCGSASLHSMQLSRGRRF